MSRISDQLKELQNEAVQLLLEFDITLNENQQKARAIENEIKSKAIKLFNSIFANQLQLTQQNKQLERGFALNLNELKNKQQTVVDKLKDVEQRLANSVVTDHQLTEISNETQQIKATIDRIKEDSNSVVYDHVFKLNEKLEDLMFIGEIVVI